MVEMPELTMGQYTLVYNMLSFAVATMLAAGVFFVMAQSRLAPKYRISMMVSALVVFIAGYHYFRIFGSWGDAYMLSNGQYVPTGEPFNDAYRYVDWLLTVPLLLVELVLVMGLERSKRSSLLTKLIIAAVLMIGLGYPGEILGDTSLVSERGLWGLLSTIPFAYILYVLWGELGTAIKEQPGRVATLLKNTRLLLLATWGFYPIAYMAPFFGLTGAGAEVALQVGYSIADVAAKAGYGVLIYAIARAKTEADGWTVTETSPATATTTSNAAPTGAPVA